MLTEAELLDIYREQTGPLYGYVSRRVAGDRALAEDIVQDTWLRAVATWPRRGVPEQPRAWLLHVARNLLASHFRRRRPELVDPVHLDLMAVGAFPESEPEVAVLNWGMARLGRRQAELLEAFYFEGKSTREIAQESGLSGRAVEGRLRRARQKLAKRLRPYMGTEGSRPGTAVSAVPRSEQRYVEGD